jgi:BirA family biotin operon repressor/biotin-[acetyl-CoA-carboxylase] ligase
MPNTLFTGQKIIETHTVDSTNNYAKNLLSTGRPPEGTAVLAHTQESGRGQMGNTWASEPGKNLTVSYVFYPSFLEAAKQFYLNMAVALAVKDCCELLLEDEVKIKWPNDIYHHDKKIAGILIENSISGNNLTSSVVGVGLNINQTSFPESLPNPSSLHLITGKEFVVAEVLNHLSHFLEKYYLQLRQQHFNFLDKAYTVALYRYQQTHEFRHGDKLLRGEVNGVTKEGKLILYSNGKEHRFAFKEVEYVI